MAGFEVIVRPVVFPNIRPAPSRSLPPADDPEQGKAVISGSGGGLIALSHSVTTSGSRPAETETERTFDVARIRPSEGGGGSSRSARAGEAGSSDDVYIDVEVVNKLRMRDDSGSTATRRYTPIEESEDGNITIIRRDVVRTT